MDVGSKSSGPRASSNDLLNHNGSPMDVRNMQKRTTETSSGQRTQHGPLGIQEHHPHEYFKRRRSYQRRSSVRRDSERRRSSIVVQRAQTSRRWWKFHLREWDDDDEQDWWFASTAIPLIAAAVGPLANVFSIAALVTSWRKCLVMNVGRGSDAAQCVYNGDPSTLSMQLDGQDFADPRWCYNLNVVSLVLGFIGNFFLLCNFTNRIRYIIALPVTIFCWYVATGILIGITVGMAVYVPAIRPQQTYTQGFWYAVIAACMYMICAMLLMVNMLGYFLGHYPQHFALTESQRTLILQTMLFFIWLAGGAAVFSRVEELYGDQTLGIRWSYVNALYYCDVTILTVGFGDLYPSSNTGRGLVFPYSVGGIIMLGLMVSSITKFAAELGSENVVKHHVERSRVRTMDRVVTTSLELERRQTVAEARKVVANGERPTISAPIHAVDESKLRTIGFAEDDLKPASNKRSGTLGGIQKMGSLVVQLPKRRTRKTKLLLLREEKDRFDAMRKIQHSTTRFKNWYALLLSVIAFGILWCIGALVFYYCERNVQGMTYFQGLYFCYVSLLTIGYGDLAPKSNAGRPFFVLWSLVAVPTMTILVADLGDTVINKFKHGTSGLADFTVLPQRGVYRSFLNKYPWLLDWLQQRKDRKERKKRLEDGFPIGPEAEKDEPPTIDELADDETPSAQELAQKLSKVIRRVANDVKDNEREKYSYEEWVEFTQLIRFTAKKQEGIHNDDGPHEGMVEWDWIGEDSPMMANKSEAEFVLDRLCESMGRYVKKVSSVMQSRIVSEVASRRHEGQSEGQEDELGLRNEQCD